MCKKAYERVAAWAWTRKLLHFAWVTSAFLVATYMNLANSDGTYLPTMVGRQVKWTDTACLADPDNGIDCVNGALLAAEGPALSSVSDWMWRMSWPDKWQTVTTISSTLVSSDWFLASTAICRGPKHGTCHALSLWSYCACSCKHSQYPVLHSRQCLTMTEFQEVTRVREAETAVIAVVEVGTGGSGVETTKADVAGGCIAYQKYFDHVTKRCVVNVETDSFQLVDGFALYTEHYQRGQRHESVHSCKEACRSHAECVMFDFEHGSGICTLIPDMVPIEHWAYTCRAVGGGTVADESCVHYVGFRKDGFQLAAGNTVEGGTAFRKVEISASVVDVHERLLQCKAHCKKHTQCSASRLAGTTCTLFQGQVTIKRYAQHDAAVRHCPAGLSWQSYGMCAV